MSYAKELEARLPEAQKIVKTKPLDALQAVLKDMPVRDRKVVSKEEEKTMPEEQQQKLQKEARDIAYQNVIQTILAVDKSKLAATIKGLNDEERDTLMKFVYRGFADNEREKDYQYLLTIHEEICKVSNLGPIIHSIHSHLEV